MYRLLIVEDEKWEREGLRDFLEWSSLGIEVAGCARNGAEGVKMAEEYRPEIILTDIRMPVMDGIQMSQKIRAFLPDARIVILSGYDDFEYAKQSFVFHAFDYILKPIEKRSFEEVIIRALRDLNQERDNRKDLDALKGQWVNYVGTNKENLLMDILQGNTDAEYVPQLMPFEEIKLQDRLVIAILSFDSSLEGGSREITDGIIGILNEKGVVFSLHKESKEAILCTKAPASQQELKEKLLEIRDRLKENLDLRVIIGVGDAADGFSGIPQSYSQARDAISYRFLAYYGELLFYSEIKEIDRMGLDLARPLVLKTCGIIKKIVYCARKNSMDECSGFLEDFLSTLREICSLSKIMINKLFTEAMLELNSASANTCEGSMKCGWDRNRLEGDFDRMDSILQTRQYLTDLLKTFSMQAANPTSSNDAEVVQRVLEIIEEKYTENLDLKSISEEIHLTPYYIGSIFKKNTGRQFNQYLNEYRIDRAKEILLTSRVKVSQLAAGVGIGNTSYFCSLFKSRFGVSPADYKDILKGRREND